MVGKKLFSKFDKFGSKNWNPFTVRPIDLKYLSANGQSISADWDLYDKKYFFFFL